MSPARPRNRVTSAVTVTLNARYSASFRVLHPRLSTNRTVLSTRERVNACRICSQNVPLRHTDKGRSSRLLIDAASGACTRRVSSVNSLMSIYCYCKGNLQKLWLITQLAKRNPKCIKDNNNNTTTYVLFGIAIAL